VVASPEKYAEILPLIKDLDRPKAQVLIESALVEMSTDRFLDLGLELGTADNPVGKTIAGATHFGLTTISGGARVPVAPTLGGVTVSFLKDANVVSLLRLAAKDEDIAFIAAPRIMASDNKTATVDISEQREYQKSIVTPEGRTSEVTHGGFLSATISLHITPHITEGGIVRLEIKQITEQFLPGTTQGDSTLTNKLSRTAETEVVIPGGSTVVIAGLTASVQITTVNKVPWLGDVPLLGWLFRRTESTKQQRNLCIFITPHILKGAADLARETEYRKEKMRRQAASSKGPPLPMKTFEEITGGGASPAPQKLRKDPGT